MEERLQKIMAHAGIASRRECEKLIEEGRVKVNGRVAQLGMKVDPTTDRIEVNGRVIDARQVDFIYIALDKPKGILSSLADELEEGRKTVRDLIPLPGHLYPVGRLDKQSEGLMLLTNDGDMAHKLTHPRYKLPKTYLVRLDKPFDFEKAPKFLKGFTIEPGFAKFDSIHRINPVELKVVLSQGLKRQIRHMFYRHGYEVEQLRRIRIGRLELGTLPPGAWRALTREEIARDLVSVGGSDSGDSAPRPRASGGPSGRPGPARPS